MMKTMTSSQQKLLKSVHLLMAGVWLSCVVVLGGIALAARRVLSGDEVYMYNFIYYVIDMKILTPAAVLTLVTGLLYSVFTKWGFVKHGWIVYKWIITLVIIVSGTFYLGPMVEHLLEISDVQRISALSDLSYIHGSKVGLWASLINTILLVLAVFASVYKPWKNLGR